MTKLMKHLTNIGIAILMVFFIFSFCSSFYDLVIDNEIHTATVTISEKCKKKIQYGHRERVRGHYMLAYDSAGNIYKINNWNAEVGDVITIYTNNTQYNSSDPQWYTSKSELTTSKVIYLVTSILFLLLVIGLKRKQRKVFARKEAKDKAMREEESRQWQQWQTPQQMQQPQQLNTQFNNQYYNNQNYNNQNYNNNNPYNQN